MSESTHARGGNQPRSSSNPPTSRADYARYLARRMDSGNYFTFHRDYLRVMSAGAAVFVQSVLNLGRGVSMDGWVWCSREYVEKTLNMGRFPQERIIKELEGKEFVETRLSGLPAKRQIRVRIEAIEKEIDRTYEDDGEGDCLSEDVNNSTLVGGKHRQLERGKRLHSKDKGVSTSLRREVRNKEEADAATQRSAPCVLPSKNGVQTPAKEGTGRPPAETRREPSEKGKVPRVVLGGGDDNRCGTPATEQGAAPPPQARRDRGEDQEQQTPAKRGGSGPPNSEQGIGDAPGCLFEKPRNEQVDPMNDPSAWVSKAENSSSKAKKPKTTPADAQAAATLRKFARKQGWVVLASESNWAKPVAILRRAILKSDEGKADPDLLEKVLEWYTGWYAPGKRPTIRNGKEFKERWNWLHQLYLKETNQTVAGAPCPRVPGSPQEHPEVKELLAELTYYDWPRGSAGQLPAIVAQSHANYSSFFDRLSEVSLDRAGRLFRECIVAEFGPPRDFIEAWFKDVLRRVSDWSDWSGDLGYFLWRPDHRDFLRRARGVILQAGADRDECDAFFRLLAPGRAIAGV